MCAGAWYGAFVGAPVARSRRSRSLRSRLPEGRGYAPLPRTPTRGKLSLQAVFFCALRAVFLCWRMQPYVCVRAGGALPPRPFAALTAPRGRGYAPLPSDSYPRQAELAGCLLCALRARVRFAQVFLCWRTEPPACLCRRALPHAVARCFRG